MRIQHNVMAMNAYRNYSNNTKALSKNLERLSSGYKINRAGDDAAGLAISEKMRAQITGLEAAQKNVKDGISLVNTAEGAMQEVQDMLNRMVYLAQESANGTYDNEVDRLNLQKEMDQLNSEIDRIADSANFNGIKLLDGSLDTEVKKTVNATTFTDMQPSVRHTDGNKYTDVQGSLLQLHKEATGSGKTSFEIDLSNYEVKGALDGTNSEEVTFELAMGAGSTTAKVEDNNGNVTTKGNYTKPVSNSDALTTVAGVTTDNGKWTATVTADKNGNISGKDIADAFVKALDSNDDSKGTIKLKATLTAADGTTKDYEIEYKVTNDGNKLKFEMTDQGYKDAAAAYEAAGKTFTDSNDSVRTNIFNGNFDIGITATTSKTMNFDSAAAAVATASFFKEEAATTAAEAADFANGATVYDTNGNAFTVADDGTGKLTLTGNPKAVQWGLTDQSTSNINMGAAAAGTQLADGFTGYMGASEILDGSGFKFGDTAYIFAGTDETLNADYDSSVKVIDIRDLMNEDKTGLKHNSLVTDALSRLSKAAEDNDMWSIQVSHDVASDYSRINFREKETYKGDADLTTKEGVQAQVQHFNGSKANVDIKEATGKALTLQIGDSSDAYNQLKVSIGDIHAAALGTNVLDISTQEGAAAAVDKIKAAINTVSSIRGTLGATSNRLDHTANNLSVMRENITDAESAIRDTDIAEEMMAYTKNNILVQSAQAMLAQANQVPQGVLQLLQ